MAQPADPLARQDLLARRSKLRRAISSAGQDVQLKRLLAEVDSALERIEDGTYGLCEVCKEPIEAERLIADPLLRLCISHLTPSQQEALEVDLQLASRIQQGLLPEAGFRARGWEVAYHYEPAGVVSGDYCDLLKLNDDLYFVLGDVTGKGVSAAMLMAHLNAMFRALVPSGLPLEQIMEQASRVFCESTLSTHFATLVCGVAGLSGEVELCIAGHHPALLMQDMDVTRVESTGLPLGMFCDEQFTTSRIRCEPGHTIFLYTDGLSEAVDSSGEPYGIDRVVELLRAGGSLGPAEIITGCVTDLAAFRSGTPMADDLTMMALRRLDPGSVRGGGA
jgi:sigma-B regulation protein RsbU (phosphoserine phosphatase)